MVGRVLTMTTATVVELLAAILLILVSGRRLLDGDVDPRYRIAHAVIIAAVLGVSAWRLWRRRP